MLAQLTRAYLETELVSDQLPVRNWAARTQTPVSKVLPYGLLFIECRITHTKVFLGWFWQPPRTSTATTVYWKPSEGQWLQPWDGAFIVPFCVQGNFHLATESVKPAFKSSSFIYLVSNYWVSVLNYCIWFYDFTKGGPGKSKEVLQEFCQVGEQSIRFALERGF